MNILKGGRLSNISASVWRRALEAAEVDESVHIRHATVEGDESYRIHVAGISDKVGAHYHKVGDEDYSVVSGQGTLFYGPVINGKLSEAPLSADVKVGDHFVIPEGYAHQLKNTGSGELMILFGCPDSHLDDDQDRTILEDLTL